MCLQVGKWWYVTLHMAAWEGSYLEGVTVLQKGNLQFIVECGRMGTETGESQGQSMLKALVFIVALYYEMRLQVNKDFKRSESFDHFIRP